MIYLATPYSHPDPAVQKDRFHKVTIVAARLMEAGNHVFSPITHCHPIAVVGQLPTDWKYWEEYDTKILSICTELMVLRLPGWEDSTGVANEITIAQTLNIPVSYI